MKKIMKMKSIIAVIAMMLVAASAAAPASADVPADLPAPKKQVKMVKKINSTVKVVVDGRELAEKGVIRNGRTFLPIATLGESLGLAATWNQDTKVAVVGDPGTTIEIKVGASQALINGQPVSIEVPAFIHGGRTMVPVAFVAKHLGLGVNYDAKAKMVAISSSGQSQPQQPSQPEQQQPKGKLKVVVDGTELKSVVVKNGITYVSAKEFAAATGWLKAVNTPDSLVMYWLDDTDVMVTIGAEFTDGKTQARYTGGVLVNVKSPSVGKKDGLVAISDLVRLFKLDNRIESGVWVIDSQDHGKVWGIARGYSPQELEAWFNDPSDKFLEERG